MVFTRIRDDLYITDIESIRYYELPSDIDRVINVCQDDTQDNVSCAYNQYSMEDGKHEYGTFEEAVIKVIESWKDNETVVVHCHAGMSRSVTTAATAKALVEDLTLDDSLYDISRERNISPSEELKESGYTFLGEFN